jgi:hypothetical protein
MGDGHYQLVIRFTCMRGPWHPHKAWCDHCHYTPVQPVTPCHKLWWLEQLALSTSRHASHIFQRSSHLGGAHASFANPAWRSTLLTENNIGTASSSTLVAEASAMLTSTCQVQGCRRERLRRTPNRTAPSAFWHARGCPAICTTLPVSASQSCAEVRCHAAAEFRGTLGE